MNFKDKIILITGSSSPRGIGAAIARLAKKYGAKVILHGRVVTKELKNLATELDAKYIICDAANKKAVFQAINNLKKNYNKIDVLVNAVGIVTAKSFLEIEENDWLEAFKTNVLGTVYFCQAIIPIMQKQGYGRIVNIASIRGHFPMASERTIPYSISKAAVINLTSALAKLYAPKIAINTVSPGFTKTDMAKTWNKRVRIQARSSLLRRLAKPEEIASVVLFLASDEASFITGQTFLVDGGYLISGK